jgi:hypothetical protein
VPRETPFGLPRILANPTLAQKIQKLLFLRVNTWTVGNNFRQEDLAPAHGHSQLGELLAIARFCTAKDFVRTNRRDGVTRVQGFPGSKTHRADYTTPSAANCAARTTDWTTKVFRIHIENAPTGFPFHRCAWGGLERAEGTIMGVESAK